MDMKEPLMREWAEIGESDAVLSDSRIMVKLLALIAKVLILIYLYKK